MASIASCCLAPKVAAARHGRFAGSRGVSKVRLPATRRCARRSSFRKGGPHCGQRARTGDAAAARRRRRVGPPRVRRRRDGGKRSSSRKTTSARRIQPPRGTRFRVGSSGSARAAATLQRCRRERVGEGTVHRAHESPNPVSARPKRSRRCGVLLQKDKQPERFEEAKVRARGSLLRGALRPARPRRSLAHRVVSSSSAKSGETLNPQPARSLTSRPARSFPLSLPSLPGVLQRRGGDDRGWHSGGVRG